MPEATPLWAECIEDHDMTVKDQEDQGDQGAWLAGFEKRKAWNTSVLHAQVRNTVHECRHGNGI